jgi:hypothetical protein
MQEALQLQEAETLRLHQQLAEASREVGAARGRVANAERLAHDAQALASRKALEANAQSSAQKAQLLRKVSQAEAAARVRAFIHWFEFVHACKAEFHSGTTGNIFALCSYPSISVFAIGEAFDRSE